MTCDAIKLETAEKILRRLVLVEQKPEIMIRELAAMIADLKERLT